MVCALRLSGLMVVLLSPVIAGDDQPLYHADFESKAPGEPYRPEYWQEEGLVLPEWTDFFGDDPDGRAFVDDRHPRGDSRQSLKVLYPKGAVGPQAGGAQAALRLPPRQEYHASYWLRFAEGFSWGGTDHGGKLPGLGATQLSSGGMATSGTDGFTARLMWVGHGGAILYLYHMDKPHQWGEAFPLHHADGTQVKFEPGRWYQVTLRTRINTGRNADGEVDVWINRQLALQLDGLRFVTNGDLVDTLYFSTFHGGNTPGWAPLRDSVIHFDDFKVGTTFQSVR